jgi:hypothetical protein
MWVNDVGELVQVHLISRPAWLKQMDVGAALAELRHVAERRQAGVVSLDSFTNAAFPCMQFIDKRLGKDGAGATYLGMLFVPFHTLTFVVSGVRGESGITGIREAVVADRLIGEGRLENWDVSDPKTGLREHWFQDPFDPDYQGTVRRCFADDEAFDALFPEHPLTRIRTNMAGIRTSMRLVA